MVSWFRKLPRPPKPAANNPGQGPLAIVAFANGERSWEEKDELPATLANTLNELGHKAIAKGDWVELDGGYLLLPQVVNVQPLEQSGVRTATTIQVSHDSVVSAGVFEYQHSNGANIHESFASGFKSWAEIDLPVFLDAQRAKAKDSMVWQAKAGSEATSALRPGRRILMGPPMQMAQNTARLAGDHEFCPCCLFTQCIGVTGDLLRDDAFYGVRLFVTRDRDGLIQADCRVNGVDRPDAAAKLMEYAKTWPDRGLEYRKQYVIIQSREASS